MCPAVWDTEEQINLKVKDNINTIIKYNNLKLILSVIVLKDLAAYDDYAQKYGRHAFRDLVVKEMVQLDSMFASLSGWMT